MQSRFIWKGDDASLPFSNLEENHTPSDKPKNQENDDFVVEKVCEFADFHQN